MGGMKEIGDSVWDSLTQTKAKVIGVQTAQGKCDGKMYHGVVIGYWIDNAYVCGGRHPWEIS